MSLLILIVVLFCAKKQFIYKTKKRIIYENIKQFDFLSINILIYL